MPRLITHKPSVVHPKVPNANVQQLDTVAGTFDIIRSRVARVILRESLADATLRDLIAAEIEQQRETRLTGECTQVIATMDDKTSQAFADLMASTGARGSVVARSIIKVACDVGMARFKKAFIEEGVRREAVLASQRAEFLETAKRLGIEVKVNA